jgi:hypothetical protein
MRLLKDGVRRVVGRVFAGRRLGVALATAGLLALSLASVVAASPANATPGYWGFYSVHTLDCISSGGVHNGVVTQYPCNGSSNQTWHYGAEHGSGQGAYIQIINGDGQCIGVAGGSTSSGANIQMGNCSGNDIYYWEVCACDPSTALDFYFLNQHSQEVIQIACGCSTKSAKLEQEPYDPYGSANQLWYGQAQNA